MTMPALMTLKLMLPLSARAAGAVKGEARHGGECDQGGAKPV